MKFKNEIIMGSGKTAYLFACSKLEIKLLFDSVKLSLRNFPRNFQSSPKRNRLNNVLRELEMVYKKI